MMILDNLDKTRKPVTVILWRCRADKMGDETPAIAYIESAEVFWTECDVGCRWVAEALGTKHQNHIYFNEHEVLQYDDRPDETPVLHLVVRDYRDRPDWD